ncbi:hypothetical protein Tco_1373976 [Tanacetum coccineum]
MASHHLKSLYAIKECSTCGSLYTKECCSIGNFEDKILNPVPDSSPCCARCGTPVDGPSCRGCAFLRRKFDEDLLAYCVENGFFKDFQDTSESSDDNTNIVNALREPCVVNKDPGVKSSQDPPHIDHNCCYECADSLDGIFGQQCICKSCGKGAHYGYNCPPKDPIISKPEPCNQTINEIPQTLPSLDPSCYSLPHVSKPNFVDNSPNFSYPPPQPQFETYSCELCGNDSHYELEELKQDQRMLKELKKRIAEEQTAKENMSIEEMMHEQQLVDREIKEITNDLGYKRFRGEEIDEEYERDCEIRIRKLKQDFNIWGSEDDYIPLAFTTDLPIEEPDNSLNMGDEHLDTIPATESDEVIKSRVENLVPIPSEFEGMSGDTCDVPNCDDNRDNIESELVESLINRDTSIVHSSKINPVIEEFADELAHIAPIPSGIVEANFNQNDDTSSDDDDFEDIEYVSLEEVNLSYTTIKREGENIIVSNVEKDDSFTFTIRTFLPFLTYPEVSPLSCSTGSEDLIFDPDIITFHFLKSLAFLWKFLSSIFALPKDE